MRLRPAKALVAVKNKVERTSALVCQYTTQILLPSIDKRIDDLQYENYNVPTLEYGQRVLIPRDDSGYRGSGADAYVFTEEDYVDGRVEETYEMPDVTLRDIDDVKQVQRLAKINVLLKQLVNDKTATTEQLRSALTQEQYDEYVKSLTAVTSISELNYGDGMPRDLRRYNQLLNAADFQLAKYEKMAGLKSVGKAKYKHDTLNKAHNKAEHMYEHALENLEELWSISTFAEQHVLQRWMDRDVDFDKGFERTIGIDADTIPRVRGSKSYRALDSGLPKLSKRIKRKECQLKALRNAACEIAFESEKEDVLTSEHLAKVKERMAKLKIRTDLFSERD